MQKLLVTESAVWQNCRWVEMWTWWVCSPAQCWGSACDARISSVVIPGCIASGSEWSDATNHTSNSIIINSVGVQPSGIHCPSNYVNRL